MTRREALRLIALAGGGGVLLGLDHFLSGCRPKAREVSPFSAETIALLDDIAEVIIPTTADSPGAKAAQVGLFMQTIVSDCYEEKDQAIFRAGIDHFRQTVHTKFNKSFLELSSEEKYRFISELQREALLVQQKNKEARHLHQSQGKTDALKLDEHYFTMMRQLTIWGYFSSEIGQTQAMEYVSVPGRFDPCFPYRAGDKLFC